MARPSRALGRSTGRRRKSPVRRKLESSCRSSIRGSRSSCRAAYPSSAAGGTCIGTTGVTAGATTRLAAWPRSGRAQARQKPLDVLVGTIDDVVAIVAVMWARRRGGNARYRSHASAYSRIDTRTPPTPLQSHQFTAPVPGADQAAADRSVGRIVGRGREGPAARSRHRANQTLRLW